MPVFTSSQLEIHYEVTGPLFQRPVLFLHGNLASRKWWRPLLEKATDHQSSAERLFPAVLIDLPGCGTSPSPRSLEQIDVRTNAKVLLEFVQTFQHEEKTQLPFLLVGHSTGGLIAVLMLGQDAMQKIFSGAVLINAVGPLGLKKVALETQNEELLSSPQALWSMMQTTVAHPERHQNFLQQIAVPEALIALQKIRSHLAESMMDQDFSTVFQRVLHPVQIVFGEMDQVLSKRHAKQSASVLQNSKLIFVPDVGHSVNVEKPDVVLQRILNFDEISTIVPLIITET